MLKMGYLLVFIITFSSYLYADIYKELERIERRLRILEAEYSNLIQQFRLSSRISEDKSKIENRIADGEMFFRLKDYERAAIVYMDIVENYPQSFAYPESLYYLAESLYQAKDFVGAWNRFKEILDHRTDPRFKPYLKDALSRFVELSITLKRLDKVEDYLSIIDRAQGFDQSLKESFLYFYGKFYYFKGDLNRAYAILSRVPSTSEYYFHSLYLMGVIHIQRGELEEALKLYQRIKELRPNTPSQKKIYDLAILALARIYLELQRFEQAIKEYKSISRESPYIDTALYELAWTYLQSGDPIKAEQALDMLVAVNPDSPYIPEARMLRGRLLLEAGRFKEAEKNFKRLIKQFTPLYEQLEAISNRSPDLKTYFNEIVKANIESFQIRSFIPPLALRWISMDEDVKSSLDLLEELSKCQAYLKDSQLMLKKLKAVVTGEKSFMIFPEYRESYRISEEIINKLARLRGRLIQIEERLAGNKGGRLKSLIMEKRRLERELRGLPEDPKDFEKISAIAKEKYRELKREIKGLRLIVNQLQAMINAIDIYIMQNKKLKKKGAELDALRKELELHKVAVKNYDKELEELDGIVESNVIQVMFGGEILDRLAYLRKKYNEVLKEAHRLLVEAVSPKYVNMIEDIERRVSSLHSKLRDFQDRLIKAGEERTKRLKAILEREESNLSRYREEIDSLRQEAEEVIGGLTYNGFKKVKDKFYNLILQAEVGITDTAWAEREEHLSRVKLMSKEQEVMLQRLDDEYNEIMDKYKRRR